MTTNYHPTLWSEGPYDEPAPAWELADVSGLSDAAVLAGYWTARRMAADAADARNPRLGDLLNGLDRLVDEAHRRHLDLGAGR